VLIAVLSGSCASRGAHARSDFQLAVYLRAADPQDEVAIIDQILMSTAKEISILRLDDEDESPFAIQEALKGIHLVGPDMETLYAVSHRVRDECEDLRFRRELREGCSSEYL
jgi:uncharacterized protein